MAEKRVSSASKTDMTNSVTALAIDSAEQDQPGTIYTPEWSKWFGYYKVIPELAATIDKKALWTVGRGYEADGTTKKILKKIRGCGKDTFNSIMFNGVRTYTIAGDFFAEIIKDNGKLANLKPINPGSMTIVTTSKGMISSYYQTDALGHKIELDTEKIFHLPWNRLGDECHGRSTIEKIESIILARNEAFSDLQKVFHRYVQPVLIAEADTDNPIKIEELKQKLDTARRDGENMVIPKGTVSVDRVSIPQYSTLDPLPWIKVLNQYFLISEGVPEVILGYGKDTTEASSKILYLAYQQLIEHNQLFLEENITTQLDMDVEYNFPVDIAPEMQQDVRKERNINNMEMGQNGSRRTDTANGRGVKPGI